MDRFIQSNDSDDFYFIFVDSLTTECDEPSESPVEGASSNTSPFKGKSIHECYLLLQQLVNYTASDVDYDCFAIMDDRSLRDDTVWLAEGPAEEDGEAEAVRAPFNIASHVLLNLRAGTTDVSELREKAGRERDGVLRLGQ